jgi:hypothetical protein
VDEDAEGDDSVPLDELPDLPDCPPLRDEAPAGLQKHGSAVAEMVTYLFGGLRAKQGSTAAAADAAAADAAAQAASEGAADAAGGDVAGKGGTDQDG